MDLRIVTIEVPRQELMSCDNVPMTVDAAVYFCVVDPAAAVVQVEQYLKATGLIAQTTLRSVLEQAELLSHRDKINHRLQTSGKGHLERPWHHELSAVAF